MYWASYLGISKLSQGKTVDILSSPYILINNILRQKEVYSETQNQTKDTFGFKWNKRDTYSSQDVQDANRNWLMERYLKGNTELLERWLPPNAKVLDAGCGSGFSAILLFNRYIKRIHYLGVDISDAVDVAEERFKEKGFPGEFLQANLLSLPFNEPVFDVIFSEGVLHHTDSTEAALKYLATLLMPGGRFLFYVYRKKGALREFTDDYIREYLKVLNDKEAWECLLPLTKLGKAIGELDIEIDIPDAIPFLGIPAGTIELQRLIYWYIFKAYYRLGWTLEEMNHVNFDWYRPLNCHRHTPEEISRWCSEAGLDIEHMDVQESGITVVAVKH